MNTQHTHTAEPAPVQLDPAKWRTEWRTNMHGECYPVLLIEGPDDIHRRLDFAEDEMPLLKLIHAAPDLLEACRVAADLWDSTSAAVDPDEILMLIRAAIAKATGGDA